MATTRTFGRTLPLDWVARAHLQTVGGLVGRQDQGSVTGFHRVGKEDKLVGLRALECYFGGLDRRMRFADFQALRTDLVLSRV